MTSASDAAPVVDAWNSLVSAVGAVEARLGKALRRHGLGQSEFRALGLLDASADREVRLLDLADGLGLDRSSTSRLVTRLEDAELVRRESCGDDRRGVYTVLTDTGRSAYGAAYATCARSLTDALRAVPLPDDAVSVLVRAVEQEATTTSG